MLDKLFKNFKNENYIMKSVREMEKRQKFESFIISLINKVSTSIKKEYPELQGIECSISWNFNPNVILLGFYNYDTKKVFLVPDNIAYHFRLHGIKKKRDQKAFVRALIAHELGHAYDHIQRASMYPAMFEAMSNAQKTGDLKTLSSFKLDMEQHADSYALTFLKKDKKGRQFIGLLDETTDSHGENTLNALANK